MLAGEGLQGLTLRAVAARAGCTTGLVLHAFGDKRALLLHARDLLHERTAARADALEAAGAPPAQVLRSLLHQAASLDEAEREEARVWVGFLAAALADPDLAERHVRNSRRFLDRVTRLLGACRPDTGATASRQAAAGLVALVEGLNALAAADPETYSPSTQRAAIDAALEAAGVAPEAAPGGGTAGEERTSAERRR
ncbi:TetR/AcrR family transcriptional regulator [Kineococcus sp. NUM-3379]